MNLQPVNIRTTLDTRNGGRTQWVWQMLLLAASWHAYARPTGHPLHVFRVGPALPTLEFFLRELGIETVDSIPHPLERLSKTCNKLAALVGDGPANNAPILLLDNDTVLLHSEAIPQPRHSDTVMAGGWKCSNHIAPMGGDGNLFKFHAIKSRMVPSH